jgi:F-type H+-transporting ATPase subunit b
VKGDSRKLPWLPVLGALAATFAVAAVCWAGEGGGGHGHFNWTEFLLRCLNFGIMFTVVFVLARKPLTSALANRSEGIKQELAELEAKRDEARRQYAEMEKRLADAEGEREAILAQYRLQGERELAKILENAEVMSQRIKDQAQFTIEQETAQAKAELRREIAELSARVAEDLLKENITADDQVRLFDDYLAKVQQEVQ